VRAEQFTDPIAFHGEGPFWDSRGERLLLVDLLAGDVLAVDGRGATRHQVGTVAAALRARAGGGFVVAVERGFVFMDDELVVRAVLPDAFSDPLVRMNDGGCDPQGRFYCGSMAYAETPGGGALYRLDPDLEVRAVLEDVTISNGLQWNSDGSLVFYNDTPTGRVDVFDFDGATGEFSSRRPFVTLPPGANPDGMAIDVEDGIWIALWGGSAVHHYDSSGRLAGVVELPVSKVTACTFGGADLTTLYITTSRLTLQPGDEPLAGSVFALTPGTQGAEQFAFAG
jgi:sugar lactone lactonase YvrE